MEQHDISGQIEQWPAWREVGIPAHEGTADLLDKVQRAGMDLESWAKGIMLANPCPARPEPLTFKVARVSGIELGFPAKGLVTISEVKEAGLARGLKLLDPEKVLALRLGYPDEPREWMRLAVETYVDEDGSHLDLAMVNDGSRRDVRTTWAFPGNQYQTEHEWFWETI